MSFEQHKVADGGWMSNHLTPVVKALLFLNIGIYFSDLLFFNHAMRDSGNFSIPGSIYGKRIWELITFQFLHGNVGHVVANSFGLFFFGPFLERWLGQMRFLAFYLICGVGGAAFFTLLVFLKILPGADFNANLVGASAGIYGIMVAVAVLAPAMRVSLFFLPVSFTMRQLALGCLAISTAIVLLEIGTNQGGEAGHLGGMIVGFILIKMAPVLGVKLKKNPRRTRRHYEPKIKPRTVVDLRSESEVDAILDKISRDGFQSLTDEERDLLQHASKKGKN